MQCIWKEMQDQMCASPTSIDQMRSNEASGNGIARASATWKFVSSARPAACDRAVACSAWTGLSVMPVTVHPNLRAMCRELPPTPHPTSRTFRPEPVLSAVTPPNSSSRSTMSICHNAQNHAQDENRPNRPTSGERLVCGHASYACVRTRNTWLVHFPVQSIFEGVYTDRASRTRETWDQETSLEINHFQAYLCLEVSLLLVALPAIVTCAYTWELEGMLLCWILCNSCFFLQFGGNSTHVHVFAPDILPQRRGLVIKRSNPFLEIRIRARCHRYVCLCSHTQRKGASFQRRSKFRCQGHMAFDTSWCKLEARGSRYHCQQEQAPWHGHGSGSSEHGQFLSRRLSIKAGFWVWVCFASILQKIKTARREVQDCRPPHGFRRHKRRGGMQLEARANCHQKCFELLWTTPNNQASVDYTRETLLDHANRIWAGKYHTRAMFHRKLLIWVKSVRTLTEF